MHKPISDRPSQEALTAARQRKAVDLPQEAALYRASNAELSHAGHDAVRLLLQPQICRLSSLSTQGLLGSKITVDAIGIDLLTQLVEHFVHLPLVGRAIVGDRFYELRGVDVGLGPAGQGASHTAVILEAVYIPVRRHSEAPVTTRELDTAGFRQVDAHRGKRCV